MKSVAPLLPYLGFERWHIVGVSCGVNKSCILGMFLYVLLPYGDEESGLVTQMCDCLTRCKSFVLPVWSHLGLNQGLPDYESGALTD